MQDGETKDDGGGHIEGFSFGSGEDFFPGAFHCTVSISFQRTWEVGELAVAFKGWFVFRGGG